MSIAVIIFLFIQKIIHSNFKMNTIKLSLPFILKFKVTNYFQER